MLRHEALDAAATALGQNCSSLPRRAGNMFFAEVDADDVNFLDAPGDFNITARAL